MTARLVLHIVPRARATAVAGRHGDALKIRVAAPPADGAANAELIRFLAARLGRPRSAIVITIATLIGHLIPLLPFVWMARTPALILAIVLSAVVLFGVGVYSAVTLVGDWRRSGLKMLVIGLGAAGIGFLIGNLFPGGQ